MYGPRPAARLCNEKNGVCLIEDSDGSIWVSGEPAFPPPVWTKGWEACAHARGCEQLLLSSIFLFCCLALSLSVFLASKRERWWGRWRRWIWGLQTSLSGRGRSAWHSPREGSIVSRQLHVSRQNRRECRWRIKVPSNPLCVRPAVLQLQQLSGRSSLLQHAVMHRDNDLTGSVDHAQCCTLHATAQSVWTQSVWTCWKNDRSGNGNGLELVGKTRKTPLLSIKTQQRADTTRSRRDNIFSSHACGNTKPGWTSSFSPSSWRGQPHARRRPHLFQWRTREKVLGWTRSECVLSAAQR